MSRKCTVCTHPDREAIDRALVNGDSMRGISRKFAVGDDSLRRHKEKHLPGALVKAQEAREVASADDLLSQVEDLRGRALGILAAAEASGRFTAACSAIREARSCLELQAKMIAAALQLESGDSGRGDGYTARLQAMSDEEFAVEVLDFIRKSLRPNRLDFIREHLGADQGRELAVEVLDFIRPAIEDAQPCPLCGGKPQLSNEFSYEKGR